MKTNTVIDALIARTSCKKYKPDAVSSDALDAILEAGLYAASGMNSQSATLVLVTDKKIRDELSRLNAKVLGTDTDPFYGAPAVIAVLSDSNVPTYIENGSLAIGNMMAAASSLGIGSCWIHRAKEVFASEEGKKLKAEWKLPESYTGIGFCVVGVPEVTAAPKERKPGRVIKV